MAFAFINIIIQCSTAPYCAGLRSKAVVINALLRSTVRRAQCECGLTGASIRLLRCDVIDTRLDAMSVIQRRCALSLRRQDVKFYLR